MVGNKLPKDGNSPIDMKEYRQFLLHNRVFRHSNLEIDSSLNYNELANDLLQQKKDRDRKLFVGETVHKDFSFLCRIWPNAKYISST